jgi:uncharacterized protein (DUF983 family)
MTVPDFVLTPDAPGRPLMLWRGLTRGCAVCGRHRLTRRWVALAPTCPRCGFRFERAPGHFVGAVGINTIVTFGLMLLTIVGGLLLTLPDVQVWPVTLAALAVAVLVPILFHATAKTLWVAIDLLMHPLEPGEALIAGVEPVAEEGSPQQG